MEDKQKLIDEKMRILHSGMEEKIKRTKQLIIEWYEQYDGNVYVSFSGGKDSTVLLNIVRGMYPDVPAVFADTGLEYPEIKEFVKTIDNVVTLRPKKSFRQVLDEYGYPVVSKEQSQYVMQYRNAKSEKTKQTRWFGNKWGMGKISEKWKFLVGAPYKITDKCCDIFKKNPFKEYEKQTGRKPFIGVMGVESSHRMKYYLNGDCNAFNAKRPTSKPIFFWNDDDIWKYMRDFGVKYSNIYDKGYTRTGCMFCMYGLDQQQRQVKEGKLDKDRFELMKETHPKLYKYCMDNLKLREVIKHWTGKEYE
jgi:3'-phosphoadenosine 5'-phosphosulfate sulfotransferase (PAPS reductase)/FAD synthetase